MSDIRKNLEALASSIESLQNQPAPKPAIRDRELSGNKLHGGMITAFSSVGIADEASDKILFVKDDGVHVDILHTNRIAGDIKINGSLNVNGEITAKKLHVEELTADVRNQTTDPLSFTAKGNKTAYGKGLIWPGGDYTKQFLLQERPDRFFSTESVELRANKIYMINGQNVLSQDALGTTVTKSNLKSLGLLESLTIEGPLEIDNYIYYDANTQRLGIGTESPNGSLSIMSWDHEFVIDPTDERDFKIGTYTTSDLHIVTDDTPRITIGSTGSVTVNTKLIVKDSVGIGVKNYANDVDLTVGGSVRIQGKKFETGEAKPDIGTYKKGDIIWNTDPKPNSYVGWICIKSGTPGDWKTFGQIGN